VGESADSEAVRGGFGDGEDFARTIPSEVKSLARWAAYLPST
jgi:hypothetical protein